MKNVFIFIFACAISTILHAQNIVAFTQQKDNWQLWNNNDPLYIYTDSTDDWLVQKSAAFLQSDLKAVTHKNIYITHNLSSVKGNVIIIGTIKASATLHKLAAEKKINLNSLQNQWEAFQIKTIQNLLSNKYHAIIIAGSDKRGAAYGVFEISKQAGISPWYWWADVPIIPHQNIYVKNGTYYFPSPSVQYRGIFINDEAPAFSGWTKEKFGGVNHLVYEKVFELLLRLKANYLWPAMWGNAFNDDDTLNPILANQYGIVMGTSHHEPMLRAQQEWKRYGKGAWNYQTNQAVLDSFWKKGIE
ncbi:glycosyl hydrolase 115 family protein, partial [Hydrotalea sp.]|uniref:glycosyl hydrolase 115 family protein n=1 Tax=Hydrotalea sp. TaxID=2881279 RepID=UPI003D13EC47